MAPFLQHLPGPDVNANHQSLPENPPKFFTKPEDMFLFHFGADLMGQFSRPSESRLESDLQPQDNKDLTEEQKKTKARQIMELKRKKRLANRA